MIDSIKGELMLSIAKKLRLWRDILKFYLGQVFIKEYMIHVCVYTINVYTFLYPSLNRENKQTTKKPVNLV